MLRSLKVITSKIEWLRGGFRPPDILPVSASLPFSSTLFFALPKLQARNTSFVYTVAPCVWHVFTRRSREQNVRENHGLLDYLWGSAHWSSFILMDISGFFNARILFSGSKNNIKTGGLVKLSDCVTIEQWLQRPASFVADWGVAVSTPLTERILFAISSCTFFDVLF